MDHGRLSLVPQFVVNPDDTAYTNLTSTCTNRDALDLSLVCAPADAAMVALAAAVGGEALDTASLVTPALQAGAARARTSHEGRAVPAGAIVYVASW